MSEQPPPGKQPGTALHEAWLTPSRLFALIAVLVGAWAAVVVVRALREVFMMLLVAVFLSFAMEPAVQYLAGRGWRRGAATGGVFLVAIAISALVVTTMAQFLVDQAVRLVRDFPAFVASVGELLERLPLVPDIEAPRLQAEVAAFAEDFGGRLGDLALGAAGDVIALGATALGLLARTLAVLLITFYLVADGPRFRRTLARPLPPDQQREMLAIWEMAVAKTGGYIYSRLLIGAVSAVVHGIAMLVLGIPFAFALALWMGLLTAFIPILGVPIGGLLLLVAAFVHEPSTALWLLVVILIYQQIENYVLGPKVQAHVMDLHPAVAFVTVIVGATLLGAVGALLALPAAAITKALLSTYVRRHELIDELHDVEIRLELADDVERGRDTHRGQPSKRRRKRTGAEEAPDRPETTEPKEART